MVVDRLSDSEDADCGTPPPGQPVPPSSASCSTSSSPTVIHEGRIEQLQASLQQSRVLHQLRMREALAAAEEAELKRVIAVEALMVARLRTQIRKEELAFQQERRRQLLHEREEH